jgi:hypothetical protein
MSAEQKRSRKRVSNLIFAGAAVMSLWMAAAYIVAAAEPLEGSGSAISLTSRG